MCETEEEMQNRRIAESAVLFLKNMSERTLNRIRAMEGFDRLRVFCINSKLWEDYDGQE